MKKTLLAILTALLLFAAACSGGGGTPTTTAGTPTTAVSKTTTTAATTAATTATTAAPDPALDLPEVVTAGKLIPEGFPTDDSCHADTDSVLNPDAQIVYCAATDEYFLFADCFLMRMDAQTFETTPLCAKEGCLHQLEPEPEKKAECLALCPSGVLRKIQYYNGRVYVTHAPLESTDYVLTSISIDGTDRRTEMQLTSPGMFDPEVFELGRCGDTLIHRGQVFYTWIRPINETETVAELWTWTLGEADAEPQCIFRSSNPNIMLTPASLRACGTKLYLREDYNDPLSPDDTRIHAIRGAEYVLDLLTGEISEIEMPEGYVVMSHQIIDGNLMTTCYSQDYLERFVEAKQQQAAGKTVEFPAYEFFDFLFDDEDANPVMVGERTNGVFDGTYHYQIEYETSQLADGKLVVYTQDGTVLAERSLTDLFGRDLEREGTGHKVELNFVSCYVLTVDNGNKVLYFRESGKWGEQTNILSREWFYLIDTTDVENGTIALQEMVGMDLEGCDAPRD